MEKKSILADVLFWSIMAAYIVFIGGYVFTITSNIAPSL